MIDPATLMCATLLVYFEARGEPIQGREAVVEVALNRVASPRYPDHLCDVVFQPHQFSFVHANKTPAPDETSPQWQDAQRIARYMLAQPYTPQTGGALYYHNGTVSPRWASRMTITARIGGHVFYRE